MLCARRGSSALGTVLIALFALAGNPARAAESATAPATAPPTTPAPAPAPALATTPTTEGSGAATPVADASAKVPSAAPSEVVERLHFGLLESMQNADQLGFQGRFEYLRPVVEENFDLAFMGSKSVGRHWKKLSPEDQAVWLDKFTGFLAANYAGNFNAYDGESFHTLGEQPAKRETRVVLTELRVPNGEDVVLNYRLRETDDGWRIIDIYLKGTVSELALRRSDFSSTLKDKGFPELAAAVDQKILDLRNKGGS